MVTYVTIYAVEVPYEQIVRRISNANKQTDCVEIFLNKVGYPNKSTQKFVLCLQLHVIYCNLCRSHLPVYIYLRVKLNHT